MLPRFFVFFLGLASAMLFSSCASIVHGGNRNITIVSDPAGAKATVNKTNGETVVIKMTPCTVSLDPKRGYFKGQSYTLKLELAGYQTKELELKPALSGWYFGNLLLGGLIGMVVVDPLTGSMWNLEPNKIEQKLSPAQADLIRTKGGFVVVLASTLTDGERAALQPIN